METKNIKLAGVDINYSFLKDKNNNWLQFYYSLIPEKPEQITNQLKTIEEAEAELFKKLDIEPGTVAFKRIFSSDLINNYDTLIAHKERQESDFFLSLTEQPPIPQVKLAVLGMCLSNITEKFRDDNVFYFDTTSGIRHIFAEQIIDPNADEYSNSEEQTKNIFEFLENKLSEFNTSIKESVLRTWLYAPHVDADYPGIVKARKELFDAIDMTKDTHYIASTGIQGGSGNRFARVSMDVYAATQGVNQKKTRYIEAPEHLSPTHIYDVTFERATAAELGQSDFLFISGTASIDKVGDIVHPNDVVKQTERTLVNISALLESGNFSTDDLSSFLIYLRDPADYGFVKPLIDEYAKNIPAVYLQAPVCRPGWLIEIEATAAKFLD